MAYRILNRVKMTVSGTPGTGAVTLGSAVAGFADFVNAGIANGDTLPYVIEDGSNYEIGVGTYSSTGPTLTRTTITQSYNGSTYGTTAISFTSSAVVFLAPLAADIFSALSFGTGVSSALGNATNGANGIVVLSAASKLPAVDGSQLTNLPSGGGATGGGTDAIFWNNGQTVNTSYSIPANYNSGTFGPISIGASATVTIPSSSTWTIV